ncbi:MAG: chlorophyllase [Sinobacteraceae bacterium]|nr:chlorophyllase [Nevskiaceae bacterium]
MNSQRRRSGLTTGLTKWWVAVAAAVLGGAGGAVKAAEVHNVDFTPPGESRVMPLRISAPTTGRRLPVVLFSHGAYASKDDYAPILDHWAEAGYVVIAVTHRDSVKLGVTRGSNNPKFFEWRLDDLQSILANLESILQQAPTLRSRADVTRIAATGHSFGGLVAQTLGGATFNDVARGGSAVSRADSRIRAVIIFSGAGAFAPLLAAENFATLRLPTLVTVGSNDLKQAPDLSGYEWRRQPFDLVAPGRKYLLTLEGADHYLGGIVGRDDLPRSPNAPLYLADFNRWSTAFLDAYLRDRRGPRRQLEALPTSPMSRNVSTVSTLQQR